MGQFHFDPETYDALMASDVPAYAALQAAVAQAATEAIALAATPHTPPSRSILELGTGTGETAVRALAAAALPGATLTGVDASEAMLGHARTRLPDADLRVARLQDPLPAGPFAVVFSALAVHHLDGPEKASLFARVAGELVPGGRFVLGDLVVPDDPADVVTPIDGVIDTPSTIAEQLAWLEAAGLKADLAWRDRDLAVLVGDRPETDGTAAP
jgi:tRNA (cmo5U34)-methyltransferase